MKINIWAYIGVIGSGKNFRGEQKFAESPNDSLFVNFSDGVRHYTWKALGWKPRTMEEYDKFKQMEIALLGTDHKLKGREMLQHIGTDVMRDYDPDVWAKFWDRTITSELQNRLISNFISCDLRYLNEVKTIFEFEKIAKINIIFCDYHSERYEINDHESEKLANDLRTSEFFVDGQDITEYLRRMIGG
jgi:hypothetical protein